MSYEVELTFKFDIFETHPNVRERTGEEEITVKAKVHSLGHPGTFYARNGDPGDPPEGPEVEILKVTRVLDCLGAPRVDELDVENWPESEFERLLDTVIDRIMEDESNRREADFHDRMEGTFDD